MCGFPSDNFVIASADNLEYVLSYARIYSIDKVAGTATIQLVRFQPQPSILVDHCVYKQLED